MCSYDLRRTLLTPPSATMSEPVINELSSEARKRVAAASILGMAESQHGRVSSVALTDRGGLLGRARLIVEHRRVRPDIGSPHRRRTETWQVARVMVQSRIVSVRGEATDLNYVISQTPAGCKVVDVLAAGSIRVAAQRSDFRHILANRGCDALLVSLERKAAFRTDSSPGGTP